MRNTTSSTIGTMSRLSWAAATSKSFCCAVGPPTSAVGLAACAAARKPIRFSASVEYDPA